MTRTVLLSGTLGQKFLVFTHVTFALTTLSAMLVPKQTRSEITEITVRRKA